jgi:hypothetical protein
MDHPQSMETAFLMANGYDRVMERDIMTTACNECLIDYECEFKVESR